MSNVTRLPGTARDEKPHQPLTSAHRFLMYSIMDMALDISMRTDHKASCDYSGHVHALAVHVIAPAHLAKLDGGDGSFDTCYRHDLYLPPHDLAKPDTLQQLGQIITDLQRYLPSAGGAA